MSSRTEPEALAARLAAVEERLRRAEASLRIRSTSGLAAGVVDAKGEILASSGPDTLGALAAPDAGDELVGDPSAPLGMSWVAGAGSADTEMLLWLGGPI